MIYKVRSGKTCISTWKDQIKSQTHTWKTPLSNKITHKDTFATIVNTDWDTFTGWQRTQAIHTLSVVNLEKPEMGSMAKALFGYFQVDFRQLSSSVQFSSVQLLSCVQLFATPWTTACQASLSITNSRSPPKPMSIELVMPSNHLILCHPLLFLPSIFPSTRVFSNESALRMRWPKYWLFSFSISPSNEYSGLISFKMD